jgi:cytochrome c oxidase assembly protein subunit 15
MHKENKKIAIWLFVCCFMVLLMVAIGGVTRLTESGLSMTSWKPITGWLPPMDESQWAYHFDGYRKSPEYLHINRGMSLEEFKSIFWLEYIHRLAGRITGLVFFIPMLFFILSRSINKPLAKKLFGILILGGFQGVVGWMMVKSGLKDTPHVSQYWLAFHLCMAFILFAMLFFTALRQYYGERRFLNDNRDLRKLSQLVTFLIFVQVFVGALVAGLDAGFIYNTFPYMESKLIPNDLMIMQPWYMNLLDNIKTVQFTHRVMAVVVSFFILLFWLKARRTSIYKSANLLFLLLIVQFSLGVATLIFVVPTPLASAHQIVALLLFSVALYINYITSVKSK